MVENKGEEGETEATKEFRSIPREILVFQFMYMWLSAQK